VPLNIFMYFNEINTLLIQCWIKKCMCWCFIHYWIEKFTVKQWKSICIFHISKFTRYFWSIRKSHYEMVNHQCAVKKDMFYITIWHRSTTIFSDFWRISCVDNVMRQRRQFRKQCVSVFGWLERSSTAGEFSNFQNAGRSVYKEVAIMWKNRESYVD